MISFTSRFLSIGLWKLIPAYDSNSPSPILVQFFHFCSLLINHHCPPYLSPTLYFSCCWIHKGNVWRDQFFCWQPKHKQSLRSVSKLCPLTPVQTNLLFLCNFIFWSYIFCSCKYIFVFDKYLHDMIVTMHVYFYSWYNIVWTNIRSVLL